MSNPLTARAIVRRWKIFVLPIIALVATAAITATFLGVSIAAGRELGKERLRATVDVTSVFIDGDRLRENRDTLKAPIDVEVREAMARVKALRTFSVLLPGTEQGVFAPWISRKRDASGTDAVPFADISSVTWSDVEEIAAPRGPVESSGSLLRAYGTVRASDGTVVALVSAMSEANPPLRFWILLLLPAALWWLVGIAIARFFQRFIATERSQMMLQIDSDKSALLELTSHQLGAPLATFRWWLELLRHPEDDSGMTRDQIAEQVGAAVDRMSSVLDSMHEAGMVNVGEAAQGQTLASLRHVIEKAVVEARVTAKRRGQTINCTIQDNAHPVRIDARKFFSVIQELLDNGMAYSPDNTTIDVKVTSGTGGATIEIADHGYGISSADLPRIFQKFSRGSEASLHKPIGSGLGLYISKGIIESAGGTMDMKSKQGAGTTFTIFLPFAKEVKEQPTKKGPGRPNDFGANLDPLKS
jgi:signal transduction histidine kinase